MVSHRRKHRLPKIDLMLIRMINHSKGQFIAVLTIITMGVAIFTSLNMASVNMNNTVDAYYKQNNFADLFIQTVAIPYQKVKQLEDINGVDQAMGRITLEVPMITDNQNERVNLRLITTTGDEDEINRSTLLEGKLISDPGREALLIEQFAKARGIGTGDEINVQIRGKQYALEVVGIVANPEFIYIMENNQSILPAEKNFGICYVTEEFGQQASGLIGSYNELLIRYDVYADEELLIDDVENALDLYGVKQTIKREDQLSNAIINQELVQLNNMASTIPILFLVVAALILMMMLSRMVKKDRIKIGVLKSIGYRNGQVLFHYVKYSLSAGVIGGAVGAVLGMLLAGAITRLFLEYFHIPMLRVEFYYSYLIIAIILSAAFCILSGLIGARGALKITPADAMRSEAPKSGKRILLEKIPFFWKRLSFSIKNKKSAGCCSGCAGCPSSRDKCNVSEVFEAETRKNLKNKDQG
jgi:putative ABC transport system permease protein